MDKYEVIDENFGEGSFGKVAKVRHKASGKVMVWKMTNYGNMSEKERTQLLNEVKILREIKAEHIVRCYDKFVDKENTSIYLVMELCEGGDLAKLIQKCKYSGEGSKPKYISENFIWRLFSHVVTALYECHRSKSKQVILHRDLKPQNIFLDKNQRAKLGDFGFAKALGRAGTENDYAQTNLGSPYYMSPEQCGGQEYNEKSDIWSLGVILYEMAQLSPPFIANNPVSLALKIKEGKFKRIDERYSDELMRVINWMLKVDPTERPDVEDLLNLPQVSVRLREGALNRNLHHSRRKHEEVKKLEEKLESKRQNVQKKEKELGEKEKHVRKLEEEVESMQKDLERMEQENQNMLASMESLREEMLRSTAQQSLHLVRNSSQGPTTASLVNQSHQTLLEGVHSSNYTLGLQSHIQQNQSNNVDEMIDNPLFDDVGSSIVSGVNNTYHHHHHTATGTTFSKYQVNNTNVSSSLKMSGLVENNEDDNSQTNWKVNNSCVINNPQKLHQNDQTASSGYGTTLLGAAKNALNSTAISGGVYVPNRNQTLTPRSAHDYTEIMGYKNIEISRDVDQSYMLKGSSNTNRRTNSSKNGTDNNDQTNNSTLKQSSTNLTMIGDSNNNHGQSTETTCEQINNRAATNTSSQSVSKSVHNQTGISSSLGNKSDSKRTLDRNNGGGAKSGRATASTTHSASKQHQSLFQQQFGSLDGGVSRSLQGALGLKPSNSVNGKIITQAGNENSQKKRVPMTLHQKLMTQTNIAKGGGYYDLAGQSSSSRKKQQSLGGPIVSNRIRPNEKVARSIDHFPSYQHEIQSHRKQDSATKTRESRKIQKMPPSGISDIDNSMHQMKVSTHSQPTTQQLHRAHSTSGAVQQIQRAPGVSKTEGSTKQKSITQVNQTLGPSQFKMYGTADTLKQHPSQNQLNRSGLVRQSVDESLYTAQASKTHHNLAGNSHYWNNSDKEETKQVQREHQNVRRVASNVSSQSQDHYYGVGKQSSLMAQNATANLQNKGQQQLPLNGSSLLGSPQQNKLYHAVPPIAVNTSCQSLPVNQSLLSTGPLSAANAQVNQSQAYQTQQQNLGSIHENLAQSPLNQGVATSGASGNLSFIQQSLAKNFQKQFQFQQAYQMQQVMRMQMQNDLPQQQSSVPQNQANFPQQPQTQGQSGRTRNLSTKSPQGNPLANLSEFDQNQANQQTRSLRRVMSGTQIGQNMISHQQNTNQLPHQMNTLQHKSEHKPGNMVSQTLIKQNEFEKPKNWTIARLNEENKQEQGTLQGKAVQQFVQKTHDNLFQNASQLVRQSDHKFVTNKQRSARDHLEEEQKVQLNQSP